MGQAKIADQLTVALSLFDWVQVFALEILDECQAEHLLIGYFTDISRDRRPSESRGRSKTALTCDQFEPSVLPRSDRDRLKQSARLEAELKFVEFRL
jgi:hypothetical protein